MTDQAPPMRPAEVTRLFSISLKTLTNWEKRGLLTPLRLPSGHRRFNRAEVMALYEKTRSES